MSAVTANNPTPGPPGPAACAFRDVRWLADVDSTNTWLMARARAGEPEGVVVVADHQQAGRGRLGRRWEAPPGASLLVSVLLRPPPEMPSHLLMAATACAAADACAAVAGFEPSIKWPNDLLAGSGREKGSGQEKPADKQGRKLAGILAEHEIGPFGAALVIGVGFNVNWPEPSPPEVVAANHLAGRAVSRARLLDGLLDGLARRYAQIRASGASAAGAIADEYRQRCGTLGSQVRVATPAGDVTGRAVGISDEGHLGVEQADGDVRWLAAGDVVHVR